MGKNGFIDWLRGGTWREDAETAKTETTVLSNVSDEEDTEMNELLKKVNEGLDLRATVYEYANTDFRQRLETLRENAELLRTEPLVEEQYRMLIARIEELERILERETDEVCDFLEKRLRVIENILDETYEFDDDEEETDETSESADAESEDFRDLHGIAPGTEPEDIPESLHGSEASPEVANDNSEQNGTFFSDL